MEKVTFKDLSGGLKTAIVILWILAGIFAIEFVIGFVQGVMAGLAAGGV